MPRKSKKPLRSPTGEVVGQVSDTATMIAGIAATKALDGMGVRRSVWCERRAELRWSSNRFHASLPHFDLWYRRESAKLARVPPAGATQKLEGIPVSATQLLMGWP